MPSSELGPSSWSLLPTYDCFPDFSVLHLAAFLLAFWGPQTFYPPVTASHLTSKADVSKHFNNLPLSEEQYLADAFMCDCVHVCIVV